MPYIDLVIEGGIHIFHLKFRIRFTMKAYHVDKRCNLVAYEGDWDWQQRQGQNKHKFCTAIGQETTRRSSMQVYSLDAAESVGTLSR